MSAAFGMTPHDQELIAAAAEAAAAAAAASILEPPSTPVAQDHDDEDEDENVHHDSDDLTDDDEIVSLDGHEMDTNEDGAGPSNAVAGPSTAVAEAVAAARPKEKMRDFNELPQELLIEVLLNLEPSQLAYATRANKRLNTITKDLSFRASYFSRNFDRTEVIFAAMQRPKLATPDLLQKLLDQGAHFSRYLAQMIIKSFTGERHHRVSSSGRLFSSTMSFQAYSLIVAEAAKRYGNEMAIHRVSDDATSLTDLLIMYKRTKRDSDWNSIEELFSKFNFMYYSRHDNNRIDFVHQIAQEPRLAPLATKNGLRVSTTDCDTIMRSVFGDSGKSAEEKAASLSTFIESGLPGLHISKAMAIKAILHQTADVSNRLVDSVARRSTSYRALKVLADSGKLKLNLSREVAELLIKKRFSRSCLPKLPYLNFVLEDFPEIIPLLPRKAALIKFLTHTDYSTESARNKLHDALSDLRPHLTQRLLVDVVANEFMTTAVPLQYARDYLPDDEVDSEVAAYEALRKCFWHPCKGASVLALYDFVDDKECFKQIMLEELRRWRFDLNQLQPDDPDNREAEYRQKRPVSLLAWGYAGAMMDQDTCNDESQYDPFQLRRVGKFTDFPGENTELDSSNDKGKGPALDQGAQSSTGSEGPASNAGQSPRQQQMAVSAALEPELKEEPLPEKNPFLHSNPWSDDNLLYGSTTISHSYHKAYDFSQCYSPLSIPLAEAVLEVFGAQSEAADIMYAHALINGNASIMDLYHSRMYFPSLMHLRLQLHLGRRITEKFQARLEKSPFRKRPYGSIENELRGRTKIESPFWCSSDSISLTAHPGSADQTVDFQTGDDYFGFGDNESDDEEITSWKRQSRSGKAAVKRESGDSPAPSPRKRSTKSRGSSKTMTSCVPSPFVAASSSAAATPASTSTVAAPIALSADAASAGPSTVATPSAVPSVEDAADSPVDAVLAPESGATTVATSEAQAKTSTAADTSTAPADASASPVALTARGRPKRKAAEAVTYFVDEDLSDELVETVDTSKAEQLKIEALTGVPPVKRGRGRPRKNPGSAKQAPVKAVKAKANRGKKRKADDDADFILLGVVENEVKPVIPLPVFIGPNQLSSMQVLSIWESSTDIPVMWKWATYNRHAKVVAAVDAWVRHIAVLMWAETKKHKARKDKVKADALGRTIPLYRLRVTKTEAHRCLESLQKKLENLAGQMHREMELQRAQFLATIKYADGVASKTARQRQYLVNRVRTQRAEAAERIAAAAAAAANPPAISGEGEIADQGAAPMEVDSGPGVAASAQNTGDISTSSAMDVDGILSNAAGDDVNVTSTTVGAATADTSTASPSKGKGKARAKGKGKEQEAAADGDTSTTSPTRGKGKGKAKAVGKGKGKAPEVQTPAAGFGDDDGHLSDASISSAISLDSAVDERGRSRRKETSKTADELAKDGRSSNLPPCGHAHCGHSHSSSSQLSGIYNAQANHTMLAAAALTAGMMALAEDESDEYGYAMYSDDDGEDGEGNSEDDSDDDSAGYFGAYY
ncbi:hypothetical protein A4X09_0g4022 [Tilletia walkeri]|uniref:F-box domain-containing protein n=1 Tax=Tilletia walkeri TaxID=117179 RepID=A0A8X7N9V4_9BASI|nr:hypothetical protein A4X09_0g4022 [Tilletia walkeri]